MFYANFIPGKEKEDFFSLLGGKTPYSTKMVNNESDPRVPRLFHCNLVNGSFKSMYEFALKKILSMHQDL